MTAIVLGNGPSRAKGLKARKEISLTKVYACNFIAATDKPDYLYAIDPWVQFDIVRSKYRGACRFLDFDLIPIAKQYDPRELYGAERYTEFEALMLKPQGMTRREVLLDKQIKNIIYSKLPKDYDIKIHNPEHKVDAIGWIFYYTGATMHSYWGDDMLKDKDYFRPRRAYILYVPAGLNITVLQSIEDEKGQRAPTGAYALHGAIEDGHTEISVYGFDCIVGEYATKSRVQPHDAEEEIRRGKYFIKYYDKIMDTNPEVNITWCT